MLWHISNWLLFPLLLQKHGVFFSNIHSEDRELKFTKFLDPWWLCLHGLFISRLVHTELLQFIKYNSGFPYLALVLTEDSPQVSCDSLCLPVCLYNFGDSALLCDITYWVDSRRVVDFPVCLAFYLFSRVTTSKLLNTLDWNSSCDFYCGFTVSHFHSYVAHTIFPDWLRIVMVTCKTGKHF